MRHTKLRHITTDEFTAMQAKVRGNVVGTRTARTARVTEPAGANPAPSPTLTLYGQVPSGKNQVQLLFRNGKVMKYPNKTFTVWRQQSCLQIHGECFQAPNISRPVSLTCIYTPGDLRTRDVSGQLDALFHLLVYAKVLKDDGLVHDVTWRRQVMNRTAPKVELTIEEVQR